MNVCYSAWKTLWLIDHQHQFSSARLIVSVLVNRTVRRSDSELLMWTSCVSAALYSSSDVANLYLAKGSAKSLHDMIVYQSQTIYPLWNNMVDAVRSVGSDRTRSGQLVHWDFNGFKVFCSVSLMFDWFSETWEQKFKLRVICRRANSRRSCWEMFAELKTNTQWS